jgi:hypothetical protein
VKLSLKEGQRIWWENMPDSVRARIEESGIALDLLAYPEAPLEVAHLFVTERSELDPALRRLLPLLARAGSIWVSWPKKASGAPTDISEDVIRQLALPLGLVDVKVCAVDATWSGLKLVIRRELR